MNFEKLTKFNKLNIKVEGVKMPGETDIQP